MGFWSKLFGKREKPSDDDSGGVQLAFVLMDEPQMPSAEAIIRCFGDFATGGNVLRDSTDEDGEAARGEILSFEFDNGEMVFVALMPAPVPEGEADEGAQFSVSSLGTGWQLPDHNAHLMITMLARESNRSAIDQLSQFTSLLAAVAKASGAVGIYWGNAGATHDPEFFMSVAEESGTAPRIMLWTGISVAREPDERLSMLSLGMRQLNLPDLLLVIDEGREDDALETFFDLLAYVANRGTALPDGDTVGRTEEERLPVRYVPNPIDEQKQVWRVELK